MIISHLLRIIIVCDTWKGVLEVRLTATELKMNMGKYIHLAADKDIIITRNGKDVALLTNVEGIRKNALKSLRGIISDPNVSREAIREERLSKYDADPN